MRRDRWHELDVQSHERDDGATVRYAALDGARAGAFGWIGLGPDRAPLKYEAEGNRMADDVDGRTQIAFAAGLMQAQAFLFGYLVSRGIVDREDLMSHLSDAIETSKGAPIEQQARTVALKAVLDYIETLSARAQ